MFLYIEKMSCHQRVHSRRSMHNVVLLARATGTPVHWPVADGTRSPRISPQDFRHPVAASAHRYMCRYEEYAYIFACTYTYTVMHAYSYIYIYLYTYINVYMHTCKQCRSTGTCQPHVLICGGIQWNSYAGFFNIQPAFPATSLISYSVHAPTDYSILGP